MFYDERCNTSHQRVLASLSFFSFLLRSLSIQIYIACSRFFLVQPNHPTPKGDDGSCPAVAALKRGLRWDDDLDDSASATTGLTLLYYAVASNDILAVAKLAWSPGAAWMLNKRVRSKGYPALGVVGGAGVLHTAMFLAGPEVVISLLKAGADPVARDVNGVDPFMCACVFGRARLVSLWLQQHGQWDLERESNFGSTALNVAAFFGPNKIPTVKILLDKGADLLAVTYAGNTTLTSAAENEDADPDMLRLVLTALKSLHSAPGTATVTVGINTRRKPRKMASKFVRLVCRVLRWTGIGRGSSLVEIIAHDSGGTALHAAAIRGDAAAVQVLIEAGADPRIRTATGLDVLAISRVFGPFPRVEQELKKAANRRSAAQKHDNIRDSTPARSSK